MPPFHAPSDLVMTILGFPVRVHWSYLGLNLAAAFMLSRAGQPLWFIVATCAILLVSVLVHELGHALAMRRFGIARIGITLNGIGGVAYSLDERSPFAPLSALQRVAICLNGPIAGLALALGGAWLLMQTTSLLAFNVCLTLVVINVTMNVANLVPIWPLDGGQVMEGVAAGILPESWRNILKVVLTTLSIMACGAVLGGAYLIRDPILGFYTLFIAQQNILRGIELVRMMQKD